MNIAELKLEIIAQIIATDDVDLLLKIKSLLNDKNYSKAEENISYVSEPVLEYEKTTSEKIYVFNEWQQKRIDIALKQVENGECISDEEAQIEIEKWFKEEDERLSGH